jgi:hypothetical protein
VYDSELQSKVVVAFAQPNRPRQPPIAHTLLPLQSTPKVPFG